MSFSHILALGSIIFSATSSLKAPENWLCIGHAKSCYWITDDIEKVKYDGNEVTSCRYDHPETSLIAALVLKTHVSHLCGCEFCSFSLPTLAPTSPTQQYEPVYINPAIPTPHPTEDLLWMTFDETTNKFRPEDDLLLIMTTLLNQMDFFPSGRLIDGTHTNYSIVFCTKPYDVVSPAPATCEPLVICKSGDCPE